MDHVFLHYDLKLGLFFFIELEIGSMKLTLKYISNGLDRTRGHNRANVY